MSKDLHDYEAAEALDIRDRLDSCIALYREFVKQGKAEENPSYVDTQMLIANEMCLKTLLYIRYLKTEFDDLEQEEKSEENDIPVCEKCTKCKWGSVKHPDDLWCHDCSLDIVDHFEPRADKCSSCIYDDLDPIDEICYDCVRFGKGLSNYTPKPEKEIFIRDCFSCKNRSDSLDSEVLPEICDVCVNRSTVNNPFPMYEAKEE